MKISEVHALISLIEDPDQDIFSHVKSEVLSYGEAIIPFLEDQWAGTAHGPLFMSRVEELLTTIQSGAVKGRLQAWMETDDKDLLDAALIVCRIQYPDVNEQEVRDFINKLRQEIWLELNDNLTAFEKVRVINHFFFNEYGFSGNREDYHSYENSMINRVIATRTGNPLLISLLYIIVAEQLELPIVGINLPNHFVVGFKEEIPGLIDSDLISDDGVLFYINPFGKGAILHRSEIEDFLKHLDIDIDPRFVVPCSHEDILKRMLNNLHVSFQKIGEVEKAAEVKEMMEILIPVLSDRA